MLALAVSMRVPIFGVVAGLVLVLYISKSCLALLLRSRRAAMWQELGSPEPQEIILNPSGATARALWSWVWRQGYRGIGDFRISLAGTCYRTAMIIFFPVAAVAIIEFASVGLW